MLYPEYQALCERMGGEVAARLTEGIVAAEAFIEPPDSVQARTRTTDPVVVKPSGILLQRCGGGVRVIRKRIGGL